MRYNAQAPDHGVNTPIADRTDDMNEPHEQVARAIKTHRVARGWSLDRTAAATGVSKAMLGQIERGESSPTVSTLWKIATGLEVPMTALLVAPSPSGDVLARRDAAALRVTAKNEGMQHAILFPYDDRYGFELYELTLMPGYQSLSDPHEAGVVEHVTVIEGEMELLIDDAWEPVGKGQSVRFAADRPHGYRNRTAKNAVLHDIIHYSHRRRPDTRDA